MAAVRPGDARRAVATAAAGQLRLQVMFRDAVRMHEQGKLAEAEAAYRRVLEESKAREPRVLAHLAQVRLDRKDAVEAAGLAAQALAKRDDDPFIYQVHGVALRRLGRHEEALASLRRAAALAPTDPAVLQSLGNALSARGHYEEAESAFRNSVSRRPATPDVLAGLALAVRHQGRTEEALALAREGLALDPGHVDSHVELGLALLTLGQAREGFREYRWRMRLAEAGPPPDLPGEEWLGGQIRGRTVLLYPEQGLGDMVQFARFAPLVAGRGAARVVLLTRPPLARLLGTMRAPGVEVVPEGVVDLGDNPLFAALMSAPELLDLDLPDVPAAVPYLFAEPERVERWRAVARLDHGFRVGIGWQGKPTSRADIGRSFPLRCFERLAALPGVRLVALQKEHGLDQLGRLPPGMVVEQLGPEFDDGPDAFLDAAAVMESLDLVVTSDTALAHLAGALGRPV